MNKNPTIIFDFVCYLRACLKRWIVFEASKPRSRKAKINWGYMSTIVYERSLRSEINFLNKLQFSRVLGLNFKEIRF